MSDLRSQFLKAGLATEKQVKKADAGTMRRHGAQRGKGGASKKHDAEELRRRQDAGQSRQRERELQRKLHEEREAERQNKQEAERAGLAAREQGRRIIAAAGLAPDPQAEIDYYFVENGKVVKSIPVSREQQRRLGRGDLGVARPHAGAEQYLLLEREAALGLRDVCPEKLILLHEPDEDGGGPDEDGGGRQAE